MKILIVDDSILFREGLVSLLKDQKDVDCVEEAGTVREAVEKAEALQPDIILTDYHLPDGTGVEATRAILARQPKAKVIFLTVSEDDAHIAEALRSGAKGYLLKNIRASSLLDALRSLNRGEVAMSRATMARVLEIFARSAAQPDLPLSLPNLTAREVEILHLLVRGFSNQKIASQLVISENTVKNHVHNILEKLQMKNRQDLIAYARRLGMVK